MFGSDQKSDEPEISERLRQHFAELTSTAMADHFGPEGVPKATTFDEIEELSLQIARGVAETFSQSVVEDHQRHFEQQQPCPQCLEECHAADPSERKILTRLGFCRVSEIKFHCNACRRSFFPGTGRFED